MDFGGSTVLARRWWERRDLQPVADSAVGMLRLAARAAQQGGNSRRLTGFWRNAFAAKNTFVTQTLNNVFGAEIKLMMALSLPAMAPAGLLSTSINAAIAGSFIGPISNFVQGAYGAIKQAGLVPEPPVVKQTEVALGDDGVPLVHVQFKLSRSHVQPSDAQQSRVGLQPLPLPHLRLAARAGGLHRDRARHEGAGADAGRHGPAATPASSAATSSATTSS